MIQYLLEIDSYKNNIVLDDYIYDETLRYIKISTHFSIYKTFKLNDYYKHFSPQIKNDLIFYVMSEVIEKFKFFFNDY